MERIYIPWAMGRCFPPKVGGQRKAGRRPGASLAWYNIKRTRCPLGHLKQQAFSSVGSVSGPERTRCPLRFPIEDSLARQRCEPKIWQLLMVRNQSPFLRKIGAFPLGWHTTFTILCAANIAGRRPQKHWHRRALLPAMASPSIVETTAGHP